MEPRRCAQVQGLPPLSCFSDSLSISQRVVRHQMKDLKAKFEHLHHEVVFAGRFYQIEPEKNMVSKYHTILALTGHTTYCSRSADTQAVDY